MSQKHHAPILEHLTSLQGLYEGNGTNYEGLPFKASLELYARIDSNLIELRFRAEDDDQAFHEELTWISADLLTDRVALWTVSSNTPGVLRHELTEDSSDAIRERRLVFRLGEPQDRRTFRQEITLDLLRDGGLEYRYAWGVPHEEFATRTRAVLRRAAPSEQAKGQA
jgi:hypothetical protein